MNMRHPLTLKEEAALLGEEIKPPPVPGSSLEPAKQSTALSTSSPLPCSLIKLLPFSKGKGVLEGNQC